MASNVDDRPEHRRYRDPRDRVRYRQVYVANPKNRPYDDHSPHATNPANPSGFAYRATRLLVGFVGHNPGDPAYVDPRGFQAP